MVVPRVSPNFMDCPDFGKNTETERERELQISPMAAGSHHHHENDVHRSLPFCSILGLGNVRCFLLILSPSLSTDNVFI